MRCWRADCWVHEGWKLLVICPELEEAELSRWTLSSHCLCCCWVRLCWTSDVWQSWLHLGSFLSLCIRDIIATHLLATLIFAVCGRGRPCLSSQTPPDDSPWTARVLPGVLEGLRSSYGAEVFSGLLITLLDVLELPWKFRSCQELPQGAIHAHGWPQRLNGYICRSQPQNCYCISADKSRAVFIHFLTWASLCHLPFSLRHLLSPSTAAWLGLPSHRGSSWPHWVSPSQAYSLISVPWSSSAFGKRPSQVYAPRCPESWSMVIYPTGRLNPHHRLSAYSSTELSPWGLFRE